MDFSEFVRTIPNNIHTKSCSEQTFRLWFLMYSYIEEHGYADTADTPEFLAHVQEYRKITRQTINHHLHRMAKAGLLKRHTLKRKLPPDLKEGFFNPIINMFSGPELPSSFARYCLPGSDCPLEFKSAQRKAERTSAFFQEFQNERE